MVFEPKYGIIIIFIDILEKVFNLVNCCLDLKVHIAIVPTQKINDVQNHQVVINYLANIFGIWLGNLFSLFLLRIVIFICCCLNLK